MEIENEVTISTHNGSQVSRQHNLRNPNAKYIATQSKLCGYGLEQGTGIDLHFRLCRK